MVFRLLINEVRSLLNDVLAKLDLPRVVFSVEETPRKDLGDIYSNIAFQLSKEIGRKPSDIAREIFVVVKSSLDQKKNSLIAFADAHPAGYINFTANRTRLTYETLSRTNAFEQGTLDIGKNKRVLVEHTSVNPNKALHIGHIRNVVLGDCVYRILNYTNHNAYVLNYVDDSGLQVADIIVGLKFANFPLKTERKFDHYCGDEIYVKVNEMYQKDTSLVEKRRYVLKEIEKPNSEIAKFARELTRKVLNEQLKTCWRMKVRYDCLNFESQIIQSRLWEIVLELMKEKEIVKTENNPKSKYMGCLVIKAGFEGDEKVLLRSDGTATYISKDIPYAAWKVGLVEDPFSYYKYATQFDNTTLLATKLDSSREVNPRFHAADLAITVIDSRQSRLQKIISKVLAMFGANSELYIHLSYEVVTLSNDTARRLGIKIGEKQFAQMSGRKGVYVNADTVLDVLYRISYEATKMRNPQADNGWLERIAESIAIAAIRYSMIKQDIDKTISFDMKESLNLEGDTGPYLQYGHARACRIIEKSVESSLTIDSNLASMLNTEHEITLIKGLSKFGMHLENAVLNLSPKLIARYAYTLSTQFNAFYEHIPVLQENDVEVRKARLILVGSFIAAIRAALNLLGIDALKKM